MGEGEITETIVNTGKKTDYDSGTLVRLEAVPSYGYYFSGWALDASGETNPVEINIDRPKNVRATFKKLSYELRVLKQGEGTVTEEIINTSKSTDYEYETTVRLTSGKDVTAFPLKFKSVRFTNSSSPVKSAICLLLKSN